MKFDSAAATSFLLLAVLSAVLSACLVSAGSASFNCFTDVRGETAEDCGMHTGCIKKYDTKTGNAIMRGCFLVPGGNDTCFTDDAGVGVCYCHGDLCNGATDAHPRLAVALAAAGVAYALNRWRN